MIDELDPAFDERERDRERGDKGRHRGSYVRDRKKRRAGEEPGGRGGRTFFALLMTLVLLGTLGGGIWYGFDRIQGMFSAEDYDGGGSGEAVVEVKAGHTATDIANTLYAAGVVKSAQAFIEAATENSRSKNIQVGSYKLRKQMRAADALTMLLDPKSRVVTGVNIPEGRTAKQVYLLLEKATKVPVKDFEAAAKDPEALGVPDYWFKRTDGKKEVKSVEGFLFPSTYEFPPKATAETILKQMVDNFLTVAGEMDFAKKVEAERGGISPYEALIVASLAQAEAGNKDDLGKVARVAYNRAYGEFPCNCLEMDVTVNYYLELTGQKTKRSKDMTDAELNNTKNPYNRKLRGMIPTPINNPGKQALEGAMDPPPGKWLYFVAIDTQGHSAFAETYEDQLRNEAKAREAGII